MPPKGYVMPKGLCPNCLQIRGVKQSGRLMPHYVDVRARLPCEGSYQRPVQPGPQA